MHSTDESEHGPLHGLTRERLLTLSDGIFAIALTLLVLDLKIPAADANVADSLRAEAPAIYSICLTYAVVGLNWLGYHRLMAHLQTVDPVIARLNLGFLFLISIQPYPTAILGRVTDDPVAVVFYACVMVATGLCPLAIWTYGRQMGYVRSDVSPFVKHYLTLRFSVVPVIFGLSIPIAFWNAKYAMYTWVGTAACFALIRRMRLRHAAG